MKNRQGQSIMELIVAMAIGIILLVGGVAAIVPILKISGNVTRIQTASALGKELLENARVLAASDWHSLERLSTSSANRYYVIASSSPFRTATGTESIVISTTTFTRFFYLDDVYRSTAHPFEAGTGSYDASAKRITVVYAWPTNASNTIVSYLTRTASDVLSISDWTGGGNEEGSFTVTTTDDNFSTSSNIDYAVYPGSITIQGF